MVGRFRTGRGTGRRGGTGVYGGWTDSGETEGRCGREVRGDGHEVAGRAENGDCKGRYSGRGGWRPARGGIGETSDLLRLLVDGRRARGGAVESWGERGEEGEWGGRGGDRRREGRRTDPGGRSAGLGEGVCGDGRGAAWSPEGGRGGDGGRTGGRAGEGTADGGAGGIRTRRAAGEAVRGGGRMGR